MTEKPILFTAPMVRAILAGTKTQTRRIVKGGAPVSLDEVAKRCPYFADRLWVRETWAIHFMFNDLSPLNAAEQVPDNYWFRANGEKADSDRGCPADGRRGKWRPGIHLPRAFARLTLKVTGIRFERLQDISEADALAEGLRANGQLPWTAREAYEELWESINGPGSWALNPWVWVVEFERAL